MAEIARFDYRGREFLRDPRPACSRRASDFEASPRRATTIGGKLIFHIFGALAEFERDIIRERTQAGLQAARARGRKGGRPKRQPSARQVAMAKSLYADRSNSVADICKTLGISRSSFYRYIKEG